MAQRAVGTFLRAAREAQELTQDQVATMTRESPWSISRAAVSAIERGQNFPGMEALLALSRVLYVDPNELIERASVAVTHPMDAAAVTDTELERRASRSFWSGEFRDAIAAYGLLLARAKTGPWRERDDTVERVATLEVRRATALKRAGALQSAIATVEQAISLSDKCPDVQAEAYVVLADLQCQRGMLPLASDAARRAIELSQGAGPKTQGWAWMVQADVHYKAGRYEEAKDAFLEARRQAVRGGDTRHLTHIEGDIGMCWLAQGARSEALMWVERAIELARQNAQPTLEASWLVERGRIAFLDGQFSNAEEYACDALRIAEPLEHRLTIFRAEWLRHKIVRSTKPEAVDRNRLNRLRRLLAHLDLHDGVEEIREFKAESLGVADADDRG